MKSINRISVILTIILFILITNEGECQAFKHNSLTRLWENNTGLITPESVLYDRNCNELYVSCINQNPWQKDNNGYIARLSADGSILNSSWATGLSAPKGMGIFGSYLYVTDIDEVVILNLSDGTIVKKIGHPQAQNLNDIAIDAGGNVYISDSKANCIFKLSSGNLQILSKDTALVGSNGLYVDNGKLLCGTRNNIQQIDLSTGKASLFIDNTGSIDGLESIDGRKYLISDWIGHIYKVEKNKNKVLLLDTTPDVTNAADIGFNAKESIIYVPTFFHNSVVAYKLKK